MVPSPHFEMCPTCIDAKHKKPRPHQSAPKPGRKLPAFMHDLHGRKQPHVEPPRHAPRGRPAIGHAPSMTQVGTSFGASQTGMAIHGRSFHGIFSQGQIPDCVRHRRETATITSCGAAAGIPLRQIRIRSGQARHVSIPRIPARGRYRSADAAPPHRKPPRLAGHHKPRRCRSPGGCRNG